MRRGGERSTETNVDLDDEEIEVVQTEVRTFSGLFDEDGELPFWRDNSGWSGFLREDGTYYRVNVLADGEIDTKHEVPEADVVESIRDHVEDPGAGSVGTFIRGARLPGDRLDTPVHYTDGGRR
ncbi:hypothetical protein EXE53_18245 [Halorubrum sp. SD626R]|uniref:hypothetical protein n=1 Tax=Halorubrum sp. SD626R TaxID=1419722 RepID=UPI0010F5F4E5|nr:hypothetical protein [Halorubrum sp. SD626R]TKX79002.1 hypothetical protein EXE53_18245 [Halorubrum sp. SD626R]